MATSFICSPLDQFLNVLEYFFKSDKNNNTQKTVLFMSLKTKHYNYRKYTNNKNNNNNKYCFT